MDRSHREFPDFFEISSDESEERHDPPVGAVGAAQNLPVESPPGAVDGSSTPKRGADEGRFSISFRYEGKVPFTESEEDCARLCREIVLDPSVVSDDAEVNLRRLAANAMQGLELANKLAVSSSNKLARAREDMGTHIGDVLGESARRSRSVRFDLQTEKEKNVRLSNKLEEERAEHERELMRLKEELSAAKAENRELMKGREGTNRLAERDSAQAVDDLVNRLAVARRERDEANQRAVGEEKRLQAQCNEYLSRVDELCRHRFEKLKGHILDLRRERLYLETKARYEGSCALFKERGVVVPPNLVDYHNRVLAWWTNKFAEKRARELSDEDLYLFPRGLASFRASPASSSRSKRARNPNP